MNNKIRIAAIPTEVAEQSRATLRDGFGHALHVQTVDSAAPCRHCLQVAQAGEKMIVLSYRPFEDDFGPYSEIGPIFVHAEPCRRYEGDELPPDYADRELVVRAYGSDHAIADSVIEPATQALTRAAAFLENSDVRYVHARHPAYGCYAFRFERG